jgi:hypothetical protein
MQIAVIRARQVFISKGGVSEEAMPLTDELQLRMKEEPKKEG